MKNEWEDYRTTKPKTVDGVSALMLCGLTDGRICTAIWDANTGLWYDPDKLETFGNVVSWWDFPLPPNFKLSEIYDRRLEDCE